MDNDNNAQSQEAREWAAKECALVGIVLLHTDRLPTAQAAMPSGPAAFVNPLTQLAWTVIERLAERRAPRDPIAVADALKGQDGWDGDLGLLERWMEGSRDDASYAVSTAPTYAETYALQLQNRASRRQLVEAVAKARAFALDASLDPDEAQAAAAQAILAAAIAPGRGPRDLTEDLLDLADMLRRGERPPCVPTGYEQLDKKLGGGLRPRELTVIAGRTGTGKSAFAGTLAMQAARNGRIVYVSSLEMARAMIAIRTAAQFRNVDVQAAVSGYAPAADVDKAIDAAEAAARHVGGRLIVDDTRALTVQALRARVQQEASRRRADGERLDIVIVDYLQLVEYRRVQQAQADARHATVAAISHALADLAMDVAAPVVALSQINRAALQADAAGVEHLSESDAIGHDADVVLIIDPERKAARENLEITVAIAKNRHGDGSFQRFNFYRKATLFAEIKLKQPDAPPADDAPPPADSWIPA